MSDTFPTTDRPLARLDEWDDFVQERYAPTKRKEQFRDYRAEARPSVKEFYRLNHRYQTYDFVQAKKAEYLPLAKNRMGVWEAMEFLEYSRRRQRPGHGLDTDRAPDADRRSDPP